MEPPLPPPRFRSGRRPGFVAVNPATNKIYIPNDDSNNVIVIDGASNSVIKTVAVGTSPYFLAVNPMTNKVYVTNPQ